MDYFNNIRDENAYVDDLLYTSPAKDRSNGIPNDIPREEYSDVRDDLPDPSPASIREKVLQETKRRQNAINDEKRLEAEQQQEFKRLERERQRKEEEDAKLTPEEKDQRKLEAKWKRDFERQQHQKDEEEKMKYHTELRKREEEERLKRQEEFAKQLEQERKAREEHEKLDRERFQRTNELTRNELEKIRKDEAAQRREEKEQRKVERERERKKKDQHKKRKEQRKKDLKEKEKKDKDEENRLRRLDKELQKLAETEDLDLERNTRRATRGQEKDLLKAEQERQREEERTKKTKDDRRRAHERHKRQREDRVKAKEETRKREEEEYRRKMEKLHKQQEREQRETETAFRAEREKQDRFRKAQEEYGKCIEDEAKGLNVYCKEPVNPDDELDASEVEVFDSEFESLHPWGSENVDYSDFSSEFSDEMDSVSLVSLPSLSLPSINSDSFWDLDNQTLNDANNKNRRSPSMPPPPKMRKPGKRGKKPKSETIRYPLMILEGGQLVDRNQLSFSSYTSESDENDMRWQVGEDIRLALSADDNFDGRDVNVHLNLPDDWNQEKHTTGPHPSRSAHPRTHAPQTPPDWRSPQHRPSMGPPPPSTPPQPAMGPPPAVDGQRTMSVPPGGQYQQQDGYRKDMYGHMGQHPPTHHNPHGGPMHHNPHGPHPQMHQPHGPHPHQPHGPHPQIHQPPHGQHPHYQGQHQQDHQGHFPPHRQQEHHPIQHGRGPHTQHDLPHPTDRYHDYQQHQQHYPTDPHYQHDGYGDYGPEAYQYPSEDYYLDQEYGGQAEGSYYNEDQPDYGDYYNEQPEGSNPYYDEGEDYGNDYPDQYYNGIDNGARKRKAAKRSKTQEPPKKSKKKSRKGPSGHHQHYPVHEDTHYHFQGHEMPHHYRHPSEAPRGIHRHYPVTHAPEWDRNTFSSSTSSSYYNYLSSSSTSENDINFDVNEDVRFKLSTSDNFDGRDIDMKLKLPSDLGGHATGPVGRQTPDAGNRRRGGQRGQQDRRRGRQAGRQQPAPQQKRPAGPARPAGPQPAPRTKPAAAQRGGRQRRQQRQPQTQPQPDRQAKQPAGQDYESYGTNDYYGDDWNSYNDYYNDYYDDDQYYGDDYGWDHQHSWGYDPHFNFLMQQDQGQNNQNSIPNPALQNPMYDHGADQHKFSPDHEQAANARHYPRLPNLRRRQNARGYGQGRGGGPEGNPQKKFAAFAQQEFGSDQANYSEEEDDYYNDYGADYGQELQFEQPNLDAPVMHHQDQDLPHHPYDPYDYEHLQYDEFPEYDHTVGGDDEYGYDHRPVAHTEDPWGHQSHPLGHQAHPMGHQGHPQGHQGHPMRHQGHPMGQQRHPMGHQGHPMGHQGHPMSHQGPHPQGHQWQPMQHQQPHLRQPHPQGHQGYPQHHPQQHQQYGMQHHPQQHRGYGQQHHPQGHPMGHQGHPMGHQPPHRLPEHPMYHNWEQDSYGENYQQQTPEPAAQGKQTGVGALDLQIDIRNDIPLVMPNRLENHLKSVIAENDGYLDESIDFSASNGRAQSEANAYQIGELGDFAEFNSNDVNNRGFDQSVSWTSGNADYDMYSDSYYNGLQGSDDYSWYMGNQESDRNEIDQNQVDEDESWKQFNELFSNGRSSSSYSSNSSDYDSSESNTINSDSYWSSSEEGNTISSDSSYSSSSISSTTSSCSSCSETYQNSALESSENNYRRKKRRNSLTPNEPQEPVGVWRYQNGQLVTLEENADIDGYFMNLSQAEEEMMRHRMCDAEGGFWCNQTVDYKQSNFGFPGFGKKHSHKKKSQKPKKPQLTEQRVQKLMGEQDPLRKPVALKEQPTLEQAQKAAKQGEPKTTTVPEKDPVNPVTGQKMKMPQTGMQPTPKKSPIQKELQQKKQQKPKKPKPETTKKPQKPKPSPIGDPRNPEVPEFVVQPAERDVFEKPKDRRTPMQKMFGSDDQPHFLSRGMYEQQMRKADAEKEYRTMSYAPGTIEDVENLDMLLKRPTTSQLGYGEPTMYNPQPMYGQGSYGYQQQPLYSQSQPKPVQPQKSQPIVTKTGEPFFSPKGLKTTSSPKPSPLQQQPKAQQKPQEQFTYQPSSTYTRSLPESYSPMGQPGALQSYRPMGTPSSPTLSPSYGSTQASSPKPLGEQFVYQPSSAYATVPESYTPMQKVPTKSATSAPGYLDRFPKQTGKHHHFGAVDTPLQEVPPVTFEHHFEYDPYHPEMSPMHESHDLYHPEMRPMHDSYDPILDHLTSHHDGQPHEFPMYHGFDSYGPHHPEWPEDREYHADRAAEYDYFAGMFSTPKEPAKPSPKPATQPKPTSLPPMKQPSKPAPKPAIKQTTPLAAAMPATKPAVKSKPVNELYGDQKLPEVPPTTPYEIDLAHSYWDKQYAQAESATEQLYPHEHHSPSQYYHHFLNGDDANENEYLALYGASELFGQLADMEPRETKPKKKRGGQRNNENDLLRSMLLEGETQNDQVDYQYGQMNLYGAGDLYAQLQQENGTLRKKWTPKHNHIRELEPQESDQLLNQLLMQ